MTIKVFTDGACKGNPGIGAYAAIIQKDGKEIELCEGFTRTTNGRMESMALKASLEYLKDDKTSDIILCSDAQYVCQAINGWLKDWNARGWRTANKKPVANQDIWKPIYQMISERTGSITAEWVRGHAGHPENERCDALASGKCSDIEALQEDTECLGLTA